MKVLFTLLLMLFIKTGTAQKINSANINDFVSECIKTTGTGTNNQMAFWLPYNYWELVGNEMKFSPEILKQLVNEMKNYMMFCVCDYTVTPAGLIFVLN